MKRKVTDHLLTGLLLGLLFPAACFAGYARYRFPDVALNEILRHVQALGLTASMLSVSVFFNLFIFFFFIWKKYDHTARGILVSTFVYAAIIVILKLAE
jgi:membrane-bound metal-dependent hydrolase YbcI (DUF457 family)